MDLIVAAIILISILIIVFLALAMLLVCVGLVLVCSALAWLASRFPPLGKPLLALRATSPIQRLTDQYVAGHFDIEEFERRVGRVLVRR